MKFPFQSLRWRLQLWHALISITLIVAVGLLAYRLVARERLQQVDRHLFGFERYFFHQLFKEIPDDGDGSPPAPAEIMAALAELDGADPMPPRFQNLFESGGSDAYLACWDAAGNPVFVSRNAPPDVSPPRFEGRSDIRLETRGHRRELQRSRGPESTLVVGRDMSVELAALSRFKLLLALGGGGIFLAALAGGWWLAGRALKPIDAISHTADRIAAGNLDERIALDRSDSELDRLARVLNGTFDRLADAIDRQKRFIADASHELRTPLTIILSETQRGLKRERDTASYRQLLGHCQSAAIRMRELVNSLLTLARHDVADHESPSIRCDLSNLAAQIADRMEPVAEERGTRIDRELGSAWIRGREDHLETLLENLLSNALSHPPEGTPVRIRTAIEGQDAILEVHDEGPGISAEHLPHLFDRFYRADPARSQTEGHSGLGLAIAKTIAESLGGRLEVESRPSDGTTFRLTFPHAEV